MKMRLRDFVENPDNPSRVTDAAFAKVVNFLRDNPSGLTADRIAYVTDHAAGKRVVLSGNKRLRALKQIYGADAEVPAEWFQDVTSLPPEQRKEFVVTANVNDGKFVTDKLLDLYDRDELTEWVGEDKIGELITAVESSDDSSASQGGGAADDGAADAPQLVEFKVKLSSTDFKRAMDCLRKRSDDFAAALMEVVNARA